jgi:hypothetical protein
VFPRFLEINTPSSGAWLCPGDSGSGFVTYENGRATVRGIASVEPILADCDTTPPNQVDFVDVFAYRDWILQTMKTSDASIAGNTRVRWTGDGALGVMGIGCLNPYDTMWGPLYVVGVEEGANCESNEGVAVVCWLDAGQSLPGPGWFPIAITGFTIKTTLANGVTSVRSLPHSDTVADFYGDLPQDATSEFSCQIGVKLPGRM